MITINNLHDFFEYNPLCPVCQEPMEYNIYGLTKGYCRLMESKFLVRFKEHSNLPRDIELEIDLIDNSIKITNGAKPRYVHYFPIEIEKRCKKNDVIFHISTHFNFTNEVISIMRNTIDEISIFLDDISDNKMYKISEKVSLNKVVVSIYDNDIISFYPEHERQITLNSFDILNLVKNNAEQTLENIKKLLSLI